MLPGRNKMRNDLQGGFGFYIFDIIIRFEAGEFFELVVEMRLVKKIKFMRKGG